MIKMSFDRFIDMIPLLAVVPIKIDVRLLVVVPIKIDVLLLVVVPIKIDVLLLVVVLHREMNVLGLTIAIFPNYSHQCIGRYS